MKLKPNYIVIPLITLAVALAGSYFTQHGLDWYTQELIRPELTPPDYVFSIAWTIIFAMTAASAMIAWHNRGKNRLPIYLFAANAVLNVLWSFFFFTLQQVELAFIDLFFLGTTLIALFSIMLNCCKVASVLLIPYLLWICFAAYLNYGILLLN